MGTTVTNQGIITALNMKEVRQGLEQKGVKITDNSLFSIDNKGTVKVDIEGDGIFDKFITGMISKKGNINTNADKYKVATNGVTSDYIDNMNKEITARQNKIEALEQNIKEMKFDKEAETAKAEQKYQELLQGLKSDQEALESELKYMNNADISNMTTKEFKAQQDNEGICHKKLQALKTQIEKFEAKKQAFIQTQVEAEKNKFAVDKKDKEKELKSLKKDYAKTRGSYNDYLNENGYTTQEARANIKAGKTEKSGIKFGEAKDKAEVLINMAADYIANTPHLVNNLGGNYSLEISEGNVKVYAKDGDTRADYTITGLYNNKTGEIAADFYNVRSTGNLDSTVGVAFTVHDYKTTLAKFQKMAADINLDDNSKEYKAVEKKLDDLRQALKAMNVTEEELAK